METTAAVLVESGKPPPYHVTRPYRIETVSLDGPGPGEILVEVKAASICHSDLATVEGTMKRPLPLVGGHEAAAIVREVGPGVTHLRTDDHVVMVGIGACRSCAYCTRGRPQLCEASINARANGLLPTGTSRLSLRGKRVFHHSGVSAFASHAVCAADSLVKIDRAVPFDDAAIFGCATLTGAGAVFNAANVKAGETVAVIGLGGVGLNAIMAAASVDASAVIGVDVNPDRLGLAMRLGATHVWSANDPNIVEAILELTHGGVDHAFDIVGTQQTFDLAFTLGAKGSSLTAVAVHNPHASLAVRHSDFVRSERTLRGTVMGSSDPHRDIGRFVELYLNGKLPVGALASAPEPLANINLSFDRMVRGEGIRQILHPGA